MLLERDSYAIGATTQSPGMAWRDTRSPPLRTARTYDRHDARDPVLQVVRRRRTRLAIDGDGPPMVKAIEHAHAVLPNH